MCAKGPLAGASRNTCTFRPSWPGLSLPSTPSAPRRKAVDARAKSGQDAGRVGARSRVVVSGRRDHACSRACQPSRAWAYEGCGPLGPEGRLAQSVEHLVYTERVGGSSPSPPTNDLLKSIRNTKNFDASARLPEWGPLGGQVIGLRQHDAFCRRDPIVTSARRQRCRGNALLPLSLLCSMSATATGTVPRTPIALTRKTAGSPATEAA
jgi:hypothetical protein